jgi:hypothetical protein
MSVPTRIPFETYMRAAALQLVVDYAQEANVPSFTAYPGRPSSIAPVHAYIERLREGLTWSPGLRQRLVNVDVRIIWGLFDSKEAVSQRDIFIDGFIDWCSDHSHQAGGTTILEPRAVEDDPDFVPDWLPESRRSTYFASTLSIEGFAGGY